jgi:hypothetical protein
MDSQALTMLHQPTPSPMTSSEAKRIGGQQGLLSVGLGLLTLN